MNEQTQLLRQVRLALQNQDYPLAIRSLQQVIVLARERGDIGAEARHLGNLALTYHRLGDQQNALESFQQALACARREGDRLTENGILGNMGNILREVGRHQEAVAHLNQALALADELGDRRGRGIWLANLGLAYDDTGQPEWAVPLHQEAVDIARELQDMPSLASRLGNLGNSYTSLEQFETALPFFKEAIAIFEQMGREEEAALRLGIVGNIYAHIGRQRLPDRSARTYFAEALTYYQQAMERAHALEDYASEAELLRSVAHVLIDAEQYDDAQPYLAAAQQLFEAIGLAGKARHTRTTLKRLIAYLEEDARRGGGG